MSGLLVGKIGFVWITGRICAGLSDAISDESPLVRVSARDKHSMEKKRLVASNEIGAQ